MLLAVDGKMNRVEESSSLFGVGRAFALLSIQKRLKHEQRLEFKQAGIPCPMVTANSGVAPGSFRRGS